MEQSQKNELIDAMMSCLHGIQYLRQFLTINSHLIHDEVLMTHNLRESIIQTIETVISSEILTLNLILALQEVYPKNTQLKRYIQTFLPDLQKITFPIKFMIIGDPGVGKTTIIRHFVPSYSGPASFELNGIVTWQKKVTLGSQKIPVNVQLHDVNQLPRHSSINNYYKATCVAFLVFDGNNLNYLDSLKDMIDNLILNEYVYTALFFLENKIDRQSHDFNIFLTPIVQPLIKNYITTIEHTYPNLFSKPSLSLYWFQTSGKIGYNLENVFDFAVKMCLKKFLKPK